MKKSVIFLTILLIASLAGTYAVYELYVKQRMKELGDHLEQERRLRSKITSLEETFYGTEPPVILKEWRESTQPWTEAVESRTRFFTLGSLSSSAKVPDGKIPRFYYREELPKLILDLENYAEEKNVEIADTQCGVPAADSFRAGSNPSPERIESLLNDYLYCAGLTKMVIDAGPVSLQPLSIWPVREDKIKSQGTIKWRTTGVSMKIRMEPLVRFLDRLGQSDRYFKVETIRIANTNLLDPEAPLDVELLITQAVFEQAVRRTSTAGGADEASPEAQERLNAMFGGRRAAAAGAAKTRDEDTGPSLWQRFRKRFIPF